MINEGGMDSMLLRFRFKNYKSFYEEATLDMMATNIKEHTNSLIEINGNKVLPVAAIYGANASGKSNIFLLFMLW
jgi:AAA15 family ATPase/GTPase